MLKKIISVVFLLSLSVVYAVPPIYPVTLEMKLDNGVNSSQFTIFNNESQKKVYKIFVSDVDNMDEVSSLGQYMKIFPKYIEIEPGEKQVIKVLVKDFPSEKVEEGEYRSSIVIEELDSLIEDKYQRREVSEGISTMINFKYKINMAVYGYIGELKASIETTDFMEKDGVIYGNIENTGNYSYSIKYLLLDNKENVIEEKVLSKLMDGEKRSIKIEAPSDAVMIKFIEVDEERILSEEKIML